MSLQQVRLAHGVQALGYLEGSGCRHQAPQAQLPHHSARGYPLHQALLQRSAPRQRQPLAPQQRQHLAPPHSKPLQLPLRPPQGALEPHPRQQPPLQPSAKPAWQVLQHLRPLGDSVRLPALQHLRQRPSGALGRRQGLGRGLPRALPSQRPPRALAGLARRPA